ncbi:hypothetical protein [Sphingobacterium kitahiroshimense]|uniref:hypothetical protein n=1 Tax=Sphingobacterium kitahiroshimense TaxID=470446 RepID=UPI003207EED3
MSWFSLDSNGNPINPNDYQLESTPPTGCNGSDQICAVQATDNAGKPVLSPALKDEMITALHDRTPSTNVKLRTA